MSQKTTATLIDVLNNHKGNQQSLHKQGRHKDLFVLWVISCLTLK